MSVKQTRESSVCIAGATGWTGRALVAAVLEARDLTLGPAEPSAS